MPDKVKKLVRARMEKTGETYQTALRHVKAQAPNAVAKTGETMKIPYLCFIHQSDPSNGVRPV